VGFDGVKLWVAFYVGKSLHWVAAGTLRSHWKVRGLEDKETWLAALWRSQPELQDCNQRGLSLFVNHRVP
jgi:hypothetical protein